MLRRINSYFTTQEKALWLASVGAIVASFFLLEGKEYLTLTASLIGITSLLFNAKGNPVGQALTVVFSLIYGYISYACAYYGEMITYLGMTAPMALLALISWLRHPFQGNRAQVLVNKISRREHVFMWLLTAAVTAAFYFILKAGGVPYLPPQPPLRPGLRRQRRGAHHFVAAGGAERQGISVRGGVLCGLFGQRHLRLLELAPNGETAGVGVIIMHKIFFACRRLWGLRQKQS